MWTLAVIYRQTRSPSQLVATQRSVCIHQINRVNSCNGYGYDDSTTNIITVYC